jgi:hypothetical protein
MRSIILSVCVVLALSTLVRAVEKVAPGTPDALIHGVYKAGDNVFYPAANKKLSAKFLTPGLTKLLAQDEKLAGREPYAGFIDCSVLYDSQDLPKITNFATKSEIKGDTALVKASFENGGEPVLIKFNCAKEAGEWRIADVIYKDGRSVLKMLKENEK